MADHTPRRRTKEANPAESPPDPQGQVGSVDIVFPPDAEGVSTLIGYCDKGELPVYFGRNVTIESYNEWLGKKEDGLRVSFDVERGRVLLREGCSASHLVSRVELRSTLKQAYAAHYFAGGGRISTPPGSQNVTPDCAFASAPGIFPLLAEVGQSRTVQQLNERANLLLQLVPGARVVVLLKIFDTSDAENGRMVAWCATRDAAGNPVFTPFLEFGRVGPGGTARAAWVAGTSAPTLTVPAHDGVPAVSVPLDGILTELRVGGGAINWGNQPPP